jgi:hypothetical protein
MEYMPMFSDRDYIYRAVCFTFLLRDYPVQAMKR